MEIGKALPFLQQHHRMVVTTFRRSGAPQMSLVLGGPFRDGIALVARDDSAKVRNLRRDSRCAVLVASESWGSWVTVEGSAVIHGQDNTDSEELRQLLRNVFTAAGGTHDDWGAYDRAMRDEHRAAVFISPRAVYGQRYT